MKYTFNSILVRGLENKKEYKYINKIPYVLLSPVEKNYLQFVEDFTRQYSGNKPTLNVFQENYKAFRVDYLDNNIPLEYVVDILIEERRKQYIKDQITEAQGRGEEIFDPGFLEKITKETLPRRIDIIDYDAFDRNEHLDATTKINYGIHWFDETFGGLHKTDYNLIFGSLGNGKTNLLLYLLHVLHSKQNQNILVFSNEMTQKSFIAKLDAMRLGINPKLFRTLNFTEEQKQKLLDLNGLLDPNKAKIKIAGTITSPSQLGPILDNEDTSFDIIAIDGMHLMGKGDALDQSQKTIQLGEVSRQIRLFTLNEQLPVLAVVQGNRGAAKTDEPTPEDIGLAYSMGQDADNMIASTYKEINGVPYFKYYSSKNRADAKSSIYAKFDWNNMAVKWFTEELVSEEEKDF